MKKTTIGKRILTLMLCMGLLALQIPSAFASTATATAKVTYEGKATLPINGLVRLDVQLSDTNGFEGKLEIRKSNANTGESSLQNNSIVSVYNLSIPKGQDSTSVLYKTDLGGDNMSNYNFDYSITTPSGESVGLGKLTSAQQLVTETTLILGETITKESVRQNATNAQITARENIKQMTDDELAGYDNIVMSHEDALSLTEDERELVRARIYEGGRLLIIAPKGHDRKNFGELILDSQMSETGMTNLKSTINLLTKSSNAKDYWLQTAQTPAGAPLIYGAFGRGSILILGFNPFGLKDLSDADLLAMRKTLLIQYNANLKGVENYDYQLINISSKLPEKSVPSFAILLLVFALSLSFGLIFGMYLVRFKKRPHGLLIGMCSAAVLSLVMIPLYSWMLGYKGAMINEVVMNRVDEEGNMTTERYAGIKGNKSQMLVLTENKTGLVPTHFDFFSNKKKELVNLVGEGQNQWVIKREDKWMMENFVSKAIRQNEKSGLMVKNLQVNGQKLTGELVNRTEIDLSAPILFIDDSWVILPAIKKGETQVLDIDLSTMKPITEKEYLTALATGSMYNASDKTIGPDEFRAVVESAKSKQTSRALLVAYQVVKGSGISLENESEAYRQLLCYSLNLLEKSDLKDLTLSQMNVFSGNAKKMNISNMAEIQMEIDNGVFEFTSHVALEGKTAYTLTMDANQVKSVSVYNQELGIWQLLKNGDVIGVTDASLNEQAHHDIYLKVTALNAYLDANAIKLSAKGGK